MEMKKGKKRFQFHKVQFKDEGGSLDYDFKIEFQFHKVQFKVIQYEY